MELIEIYLAEQKVSRLGLKIDSAEQVFDSLRARGFKKTGVQDSVFKKSFDYYLERPKEMELIYTALVDSLQLMEQRMTLRPEIK